jgi:hypothetical protein
MKNIIEFNFYKFNDLYKNNTIKIMGFIIKNFVNEIPQGRLIIQGPPMDFQDAPIDIQWEGEKWKFYCHNINIYYNNNDQKNDILYELFIYHTINNMAHNSTNCCWNNYTNKNIIDILFNNYKIDGSNSIDDKNFPSLIQFQETDMDFFKGVLYRSSGLFYYKDKIIVNNSIIKNFAIESQEIINRIEKNQPFHKIKTTIYDYQNSNQAQKMEGNSQVFFQGQYEKNYYGNNVYDDLNCNIYFLKSWNTSIGDKIQKEVILGNYFIFTAHPPLQTFNYEVSQFIEHIPSDHKKDHFFNMAFTGNPDHIKINYKKPTPGFLQGFVTAIENKYSNEYGDVLVKFPWDKEPMGKSKLSNACWVRCIQSLAGPQWGSWMIPQPNQEVVVGFFNNDIDQPIIVGTLYNGYNKPQYNKEDYNPKEIILKTKENQIIIDEKEKNIVVNGNHSIQTTIQGNYDFLMKKSKENSNNQSYNIQLENGNINIKIDDGNFNFTIKGDVNFDIEGNCNFNIKKDFNLKCKNITIENTKTQWSQDKFSLKTMGYNLKSENSVWESSNHKNKFNNYLLDTTYSSIKSLKTNFNSKLTNIDSLAMMMDCKILDINSYLLDITGTIINISADIMLNIKVSALMNITSMLFNLSCTMTVIIRGAVPGTIGCFPPFYP